MKISRLIDGLCILSTYDPKGKGECCPGHDEIFVHGPPLDKMKPEDVKRLDRLGFFWSEDEECWMVFT